MALRPCLGGCGRLIESGSYCGSCDGKRSVLYAPGRMRGRRWQRKRAAVFRRSGDLCERCQRRTAAEIHHQDGDVTNNALSNLLAVCKPCHLALEAAKRAG